MAEFDTVIRGGLVATATDIMLADVGIEGETVTAIAKNLPAGKKEIDAQGKYVLPGGVDSHCHIEQPSSISGKMNADTFLTGTRSAACGGTTSVICFSPQRQGWSLADSTADYHERAKKAAIDYTFHLIINDPNEDVMATLPGLIADGHRSIKIFMTYDSNRVEDAGVLVLVPDGLPGPACLWVASLLRDVSQETLKTLKRPSDRRRATPRRAHSRTLRDVIISLNGSG